MRNRRNVADRANIDTSRCQRTDGRLAARSGTGNAYVDCPQTVIARHGCRIRRSLLRRERRALARTAEAKRTRTLPAERIAHLVGDGHDGVVERGLNVANAERDILALALFELLVLASFAGCGLLLWFRH